MDITPYDQFFEVLASARVDDSGSCYHQNFSTGLPGEAHLCGHLADDCALGFFNGDAAGHEFEGAAPLGGPLNGRDANAVMTHRNQHPFAHLTEFYCAGLFLFGLNGQAAVHRSRPCFDPLAVGMHESLLIRGYIEIRRKYTIRGGWNKLSVNMLDQCAPL